MSKPQSTENTAGSLASQQCYETAADYYSALFEVKLAQTPQDVEMSQALRYRVYCEETAFLPKEDNPGGLESDSFDAQSDVVLLTHKSSGNCVGTVRVILPGGTQNEKRLFPAMESSPAMRRLVGKKMPLETTGELSRFTIAPEFRQRSGDTLYQQVYTFDEGTQDLRRIIPYMALGLFAGILEVVTKHQLTHLCAVIDPALLRMLRRLHLHFPPVGPLVDFHGLRQPVFVSTRQLYDGMMALPDAYLRIVNRDGRLHF